MAQTGSVFRIPQWRWEDFLNTTLILFLASAATLAMAVFVQDTTIFSNTVSTSSIDSFVKTPVRVEPQQTLEERLAQANLNSQLAAQNLQQDAVPAQVKPVEANQQTLQQEKANAPAQAQQAQQEVAAFVPPKVYDFQVTWTEVDETKFDPSTIPVEEGFYHGSMWIGNSYAVYTTYYPGRTLPIPPEVAGKLHPRESIKFSMPTDNERSAYKQVIMNADIGSRYVWRILPETEVEGFTATIAPSRDRTDKSIVLVSMIIDNYGPVVMLSVDGEKSFCRLNLLPRDHLTVYNTRVKLVNGEIFVYGSDGRRGNHWWETVLQKNQLPCS